MVPFYTEGIAEITVVSKTSTNVLKNTHTITFTRAYHRFFHSAHNF